MLLTWYLLVAFMITAYVVLDGFDLGVGILHLFVARTEEERTLLLRTIGPVWDGNEVWLIAGGGTLFFAFPLLYASGFSGFYLPLMIVLWLLILRGIGIELRGHIESPVWRSFFNGWFGIASLLLTIFFGAAHRQRDPRRALAARRLLLSAAVDELERGPFAGILDWYTSIAGLLALVALALHGANYAALKTGGELNLRMRRAAAVLVSRAGSHDCDQPGGNALDSTGIARQLPTAAAAIRDPAPGRGIPLRYAGDGTKGK